MRNIYKVLFTVILGVTSLLMLSTEQLFSQTTFVVGTGTTNSYTSPFCNLYKNSWHEMIFTPDELSAGAGCTLNSIAFQSASRSTLAATTVKIYVGERSTANHTSTTDWTPMSNLTLVYSGNNITIGTGSAGTWQTFNFNTPYDYSGTNNLVVVVTKTANTYASACTWYYTAANATSPGLYRQSDSDATYGTTHPGTNAGTTYGYRANTKFNFGNCCTPRPGNFSFSTTTASVIAPATIDVATYLTNTTGQTNLTWTSDNNAVATVTNNGVVSALAEGTAIISVTYPASGGYCGGRATFTVNVSDGCIAIGNGTSCAYTYGPVNDYFKYSYRQIIYHASDLVQGAIRSISFQYCYTTAMTKKTNVNIYMGHTNKTSFSSSTDWIAIGSMQLVYSGPVNATRQGWNAITLTNPFEYDGISNLVVAIDDNSGQYDGSSYTYYYTAGTGTTTIYTHSDSENTNPASPPSGSTSSNFPNTKFCIDACTQRPGDFLFSPATTSVVYPATVNVGQYLINTTGQAVTWSSNNPAVASVNNSGVVTATTEGTAVITASFPATSEYCSGNAQFTINVSDGCPIVGTGTSCSYIDAPVNSFYNYGYKQIIYPASNFFDGVIRSIAFQYCYTVAMIKKTNVNIYMGTTNKTAFTSTADWIDINTLQLVYSGPLNATTAGWHTIALTNEFEYNGIGNIVLAIDDNSGQYDGSSYTFDYSTASGNVAINYYSDATNADPTAPPTANQITANFPNTKFCIESCDGPIPVVTFAQDVVTTSCSTSVSQLPITTPHSTGSVSYSSSNTFLATVDPNTGVVTPTGNGTGQVVITVNISSDANNCYTSGTYIVNIIPGSTDHSLIYNTTAACAGTASPVSIAGTSGTVAFVTNTTPTCTSAQFFNGWNTSADGSGTAYYSGDEVNIGCHDVTLYAQYDNINYCRAAIPFCTEESDSYSYTASTTSQNAIDFANGGSSIGCLYFTPSPTWFYMRMDADGDMLIYMSHSAGRDIDFACWGPFDAMTIEQLTAENCTENLTISSESGATFTSHRPTDGVHYSGSGYDLGGYPVGNMVDCSYTSQATEWCYIHDAHEGEWYIFLITNYSQAAGTIVFESESLSVAGVPSSVHQANTDCTIVPCGINGITTNVGECDPLTNTYSITGFVYFEEAPTSGTLVVKVEEGETPITYTINRPFNSPATFTLTGLTPDDIDHLIIAEFTATDCSRTASFHAPASCDGTTFNQLGPYCVGETPDALPTTSLEGITGTWSPATISTATAGTTTYTFTPTGSTSHTTMDIVVNANPTITIGTPATLTCATTSVNLTATSAGTTYSWSNGGSASTTTVSAQGTYTVTVTDGNGCSNTASVTVNQDISQPTVSITNNTGATQLTCLLETINVTATGSGVSYAWSNGTTTAANTITAPGTYTVTATGSNGCTNTASITITESSDRPTISITNNTGTTTLNCNTTSISLTATGSGNSYSWSTGSNNAGITVNTDGTYSVTSTGSNGCTSQTSITITESSNRPTVSINTPQTLTCALVSQQLNVTTNAPTFVWSTNATTNSINVTNPGTYSVTATGANGCTNTASVTVNQNITAPTLTLNTPQTLTCTTTSQTLTATTNANTYAWSTGANSQSITVTSPNTYSVTVTGTNGCTSTASVVVNQNIVTPTLTLSQPQVLTCATPSQTITATTNVTTYAWSTGANSQSITVTSPNTYSVTVTGTNGCTNTASVVVTQNVDIPTLSINQPQTLTCNTLAQTLTATTNANTYSWSTGSNTPSINVTNPGTYTVTVTGTNGCINTASVVVNQDIVNPTLSLNTPQPLTCSVPSQTLTATTNANTYAWSTGAATQSITVNTPNTYVVTVTGTNGCTTSASVVVTQNSVPPTVSINQPQTLTCTTPVQQLTATSSANIYSWSTGATAQSINVTTPNTYGVTVTATNGCTASASVTVNQNIDTPLLSITNNTGSTELTCLLGSISVVANGNAASYSWSNNLGNNATQSLTMPGTYTVTATGSNGCTTSQQIVITESADRPTIAVNNNSGTYQLTCNTTSISVTATGSGNSYIWSNGVTTANNTFNQPGTYTVTTTATNGCTNATNVIISQDVNPPTLSITNNTGTTELTCAVTNISLSGTGTGVSYAWSNGTNTAMTNITVPGTYTLTSTALNGCISTTSIVITQNVVPPTVTLNNNTGVTELDCRNTSISISANGGVSYVWSNGTIGNENTFTVPGTYTVTVTADNGCTNTNSITLTQATPLTASIVSVGEIECNGGNTSVSVTANGGTPNYIYTWSNGQSSSTATGLVAGSYTVTINDMGGCSQVLNVDLTQPDPVRPILTPINIQCGNALGTISANVTGGVQPYTYNWSNGVTSQNNTRLYRGSYTVTVNDAHGCQQVASASIDIEGTIMAEVNIVSPISCSNTADGSLAAVSPNGAAPFSYHWSTNDVSSTVNNLASGSYSVTISDEWGCMGVGRNSLETPEPIKVNTATVPTKCYDTKDGSIALTLTGGNAPFTFVWNNPLAQGQNPTGLTVGQYIVTITDATNCTATATTTITAPEEMFLDVQTRDISCFGNNNGVVTIATTGGKAPYSYSITTAEGVIHTSSYSKFAAGSYEIVVTDYNGCSKQDVAVINEPPAVSGDVIVSNPTCYEARDGQIEFSIVGGVEPYTFIYNTYYTDVPIVTGLVEGVYEVSVTDANGCLYKMDDALLRDTPVDCIWIPNVFTPNGDGVNDEWIIEHIENFPDADIYVYNRWGQPLYQAKGSEEPWNGTYKDHFVPAGCYMYIIDLHTNHEVYSGIVTIVY